MLRIAFMRKAMLLVGAAALVGCASRPVPYDDSLMLKAANPRSILVMPPINLSPDVKASNSVWSQAVLPLAEAGYYVLPVSLVAETFRENGLSNPPEAQQADPAKLREFFGADAALYMRVLEYGTSFKVISSGTTVVVDAKLIDLRTGTPLWRGIGRATTEDVASTGSLVGDAIKAVVQQVIESSTERGHPIAGVATQRLVAAGRPGGLLYGPRSPLHGKESASK